MTSPRRVTFTRPAWLGEASFMVCAMAVLVVATAAATRPYGGLVVAAAAGVLVAVTMPPRVLIVGWAAILPIYATVGIPPTVWDVARLTGTLVIVVRVRPVINLRAFGSWLLPLLLLGGWTIAVAILTRGESPIGGATMVLSAVVAVSVVMRAEHRLLLAGFATGATLSAAAAVAMLVGLPNPSPAINEQVRVSGLSNNAPRLSIELALAMVIMFMALRTAQRRWPLITALFMCAVALAGCGGRNGLVGLVAATLIGLVRGALKPMHVAAVVACGYAVLWLSEKAGFTLLTIARLADSDEASGGRGDLSAGRTDALALAWRSIKAHPLFGEGMYTFGAKYRIVPHMVPASMAVAGGIFAGLLGLWLCLMLLRQIIRRPHGDAGLLAAGLSAVLLVSAMLEPTGPFVGVGLVVALLVAGCMADERTRPEMTT